MSKKQAIAFFEEISKNKQLAQEVEKVVEGNNSDEAKAKELISLAKKHNFIFTPEDAQNAQETLKKPLSPDEMLEVSGGKFNLKSSLMAMALLAGLGAAGAALSNMEASAMKRSTPPDGSYSCGGKRGKDENGQARKKGGTRQRTPQPVEPTNSGQNETPPSNDQGLAQSDSQQTTRRTPHSRPRRTSGEERHAPRPPREEKKAWASTEHDNKAAARFDGIAGCTGQFLRAVRGQTQNGYLPNAVWPAVPQFEQTGDGRQNCRYCNAKLTSGQSGWDPFCKNPKCIFPWTFRLTSSNQQPSQRHVNADVCARWALLPALILDSRHKYINSTGNGGTGEKRKLTIETPAEAWAVWQLIVGNNNAWVDVTNMMVNYGVDDDVIREVLGLLEDSYDNLVLGNESFIALGSEVQQLVSGYNDSWQQIRTTMEQRGYDAEGAIKLLEKSYNMLTDEQRQLGAQQWQQAEEARRPAIEEARRQVIEMLQRGEKLSVEQAKKIAPTLKCGNCGKTGASTRQVGGRVYFLCPKCRKGISNKPDALLAMLEEVAAENAPVGMADAEQNEQQMGTQDMSQFNPEQQMMTQQNMFAMEMDDDGDYEDNFDMGGYNGYENDNTNKPREKKERREDYENMQMMEEDIPLETQTRHNVVRSAFRPSTEDFQIMKGTKFNQELQGYSQRHLQLMMPLQAERRFEMQHKDYENQETNPNIPQLPHLQPHRSMILENTNETVTPLATANLDDISDLLVDELLNDNPDVNRIKRLLQRAREVQNPGHSVNGFTNFNDLINFVLEVANDFGRDNIYELIESWRYPQGK